MVSLLRSLNNDLPKENVLVLPFSIYSLVNKKVLFCKWVLESGTQIYQYFKKTSINILVSQYVNYVKIMFYVFYA